VIVVERAGFRQVEPGDRIAHSVRGGRRSARGLFSPFRSSKTKSGPATGVLWFPA
jgi:hypothetical protein